MTVVSVESSKRFTRQEPMEPGDGLESPVASTGRMNSSVSVWKAGRVGDHHSALTERGHAAHRPFVAAQYNPACPHKRRPRCIHIQGRARSLVVFWDRNVFSSCRFLLDGPSGRLLQVREPVKRRERCGVSSYTWTNCFPRFSPENSPRNAFTVLSNPWTMVSLNFSCPSCTHFANWEIPSPKRAE